MPEVNARILLWGIAGSGKTTTLQTIHDKLRSDLRGDVRHEPTRLDPTIQFEVLPITLGQVGGVGTQIEIIAVPGAPDLEMTRKQLLDEVDGVVLVLDCSPERIEQNLPAIEELRHSLDSYGRTLETLPLVLQYNKRDIADPFAIEDLHRRIGLDQAAVFETIATTGHGILATLTTISKHVVRTRRGHNETTAPTLESPPSTTPVESAPAAPAQAAAPPIEPTPEPAFDANADSHDILEAAILAEGEAEAVTLEGADEAVSLDLSPDFGPDVTGGKPETTLGADLRIVSVGQASVQADGGLRLPIVLGDGSGQSRSVVLSLRLDGLSPGSDD